MLLNLSLHNTRDPRNISPLLSAELSSISFLFLLKAMSLSLRQTLGAASCNHSPIPKPKSGHQHHPPSTSKPSAIVQKHHVLRFKADYFKKLHYLRNIGLVSSNPRNTNAPPHETLDEIIALIDHLKSSGFLDSEITKLASYCPQLFSSGIEPDDISPAFTFLRCELGASLEEAKGLVMRCPHLLFADVEHKLRPTVSFLRDEIGVENLNLPNNLNAHLLNTQVSKLEEKLDFLVGVVGFTREEAVKACGRMRALFGYSVVNVLRPKFEYLIWEMRRDVGELKRFPQYFGFSLTNRIIPRHLHLKRRGVRVSLRDLLVYGDDKFYSKWK